MSLVKTLLNLVVKPKDSGAEAAVSPVPVDADVNSYISTDEAKLLMDNVTIKSIKSFTEEKPSTALQNIGWDFLHKICDVGLLEDIANKNIFLSTEGPGKKPAPNDVVPYSPDNIFQLSRTGKKIYTRKYIPNTDSYHLLDDKKLTDFQKQPILTNYNNLVKAIKTLNPSSIDHIVPDVKITLENIKQIGVEKDTVVIEIKQH